MVGMTSGSFDETNLDSFYFPGVNYDDARNILNDEDEGVFLIRDSSTRGGFVVCVKEGVDVSQYSVLAKKVNDQNNFYIREELPFKNLSTLLSFYKRNKFKTTPLTRPVSNERVILRRTNRDGTERGYIKSEFSGRSTTPYNDMRHSAPPDMSKPFESTLLSPNHPPLYARVVKAREPRSYTRDLPLKVDDVIRVTAKNPISGTGTGELNGVVGDFPLINVEFIKMPKS